MTTQHGEKRLARHEVKNLVISCIDFRFKDDMHSAIKQTFGIHDFDEIKLAGGGGNLCSLGTPERKKTLMDDIALAVTAHGVENIFIITHQNCGAYAKSGASFPKDLTDAEREFHQSELGKATEEIKSAFPDVHVHTAFAEVDPVTDDVRLCI